MAARWGLTAKNELGVGRYRSCETRRFRLMVPILPRLRELLHISCPRNSLVDSLRIAAEEAETRDYGGARNSDPDLDQRRALEATIVRSR